MPTAIEHFAHLARRYRAWADASPSDPASDIVVARALLSELYCRAMLLPRGDGETDAVPSRPEPALLSACFERFERLPVTSYSQLTDPLDVSSPEVVVGSLADDLTDIYADLCSGLSLYDRDQPDLAAWEWRFSFETHWGQHLVSALQALHHYDSGAPGSISGAP